MRILYNILKQQSNALSAALQSPEILKKSYEEATNAAGSAAREQSEYEKSVQYSIDRAKAKLEELASDFIDSNFLKNAIELGGKFIEVIDNIIDKVGTIPALFTSVAGVLSMKSGLGRDKMQFLIT